MTLKDIEYVSTIAKYKSFSKAAEKLYISQSALSQAIKKLEDDWEISLFKRGNKEVYLTEAGNIFIEKGKVILELSNELEQEMKEMSSSEEKIIRVGVSQFYGKFFFPKIIPVFNKKYPDTQIRIFEYLSQDLEALLFNGEIDVFVATLPITNSKLAYKEFFTEDMVLAVPKKDFPNLKNIDNLSLFKDRDFILPIKSLKTRDIIDKMCKSLNFKPNCILESKNFDTINSLVAQNVGIGFVPNAVEHHSQVRYIKIKNELCKRNFAIVYKKSRGHSHLISKFIKVAQEVMKDF